MMKQSSENHLHTWWRTLRGKEFLQNAIVHWLIIAIFFLVLVHSAVIVYFLRPTDSALILHYNVYFGVDLIGAWWHVYALPLGGFLLFLLNTILAYWFFAFRERIISYILLLAALFVQMSLLVASSTIIFINY